MWFKKKEATFDEIRQNNFIYKSMVSDIEELEKIQKILCPYSGYSSWGNPILKEAIDEKIKKLKKEARAFTKNNE